MLVGCNSSSVNEGPFTVEDLVGNWIGIRDDGEIAVSHTTDGNFVMILNEDGTGLRGNTGRPNGVSPMTWEIRNGNHLYDIGDRITFRYIITLTDDGILRLLDFYMPQLTFGIYIRVDYIEITDDMMWRED